MKKDKGKDNPPMTNKRMILRFSTVSNVFLAFCFTIRICLFG